MTPATSPDDQTHDLKAASENAGDSASLSAAHGVIEHESSQPAAEHETATESAGLKGWWTAFASTYVTIFLAEIGDKTQVTTLLMSAESHKPWMVFAGAGTALVCTSLLGVLLGRWLATRLKPRTLEVGAGITLLIITLGLGWDIFQGF